MSETADNDFQIERRGDGLAIVHILAQELTMFHVPELRADVMSLVAERPARILFDFTPTAFIDSSAIAMLFKVQNEVGGDPVTRVGVCGLRPGLLKVLETVVKQGGIQFYESIEAALQAD